MDPTWDSSELALIQALEYPPTKPFSGRDRVLANLSDLQPYGKSSGERWDKTIWNTYNQHRISEARRNNRKVLSETDVQAGYLYLDRILKAAKERDIPEPAVNNDDNDDDNSDFETPYEVNLSLPTTTTITNHLPMPDFSDKNKEPLRPGDVIQYFSPIYCAGDPRGLRTATVISTDPFSKGYMIRLDNTEMVPNEHMVKRIKVVEKGKLYEHPGFYRQINRFVIKKRELVDVDRKQLFLKQSEQVGKIVDRNIAKFRKTMKEKGLPTDFVPDFKSRRKLKADEQLEQAMQRKKDLKTSKKSTEESSSSESSDDVLEFRTAAQKKASPPPSKMHGTKKKASPLPEKSSQTRKPSTKASQESSSSDSGDDSLEFVTTKKMAPPKAAGNSKETSDSSQSGIISKHRARSTLSPASKKSQSSISPKVASSHISKGKLGRSTSQSSRRDVRSEMLKKDSVSPKKSLNPMVHDESDSESSMENYGLDLRLKEKETNPPEQPVGNSETKSDQELDLRRQVKQKPVPTRGPTKSVTIDRKTERILPSQRRYLPDKIDKPTIALSKVNSRTNRPAHRPTMKISASVRETPEPRRERKRKMSPAFDLSLSDDNHKGDTKDAYNADRSSQESDCVYLTGPRQAEASSSRQEKTNTSAPQLKEHTGRTKEKRIEQLSRIKRKGRYMAEDDDIEDSEEDQRRARHTPTASKYGNYQPVAQISSSTKMRDIDSIGSFVAKKESTPKRKDYLSDTSEEEDQENHDSLQSNHSFQSNLHRVKEDSLSSWQKTPASTKKKKRSYGSSASKDRPPSVIKIG